jgi:hypothetical protein
LNLRVREERMDRRWRRGKGWRLGGDNEGRREDDGGGSVRFCVDYMPKSCLNF